MENKKLKTITKREIDHFCLLNNQYNKTNKECYRLIIRKIMSKYGIKELSKFDAGKGFGDYSLGEINFRLFRKRYNTIDKPSMLLKYKILS